MYGIQHCPPFNGIMNFAETSTLRPLYKERGNEVKSLLRRVANLEDGAARECIQVYGGLVWSMAKATCESEQDAEQAAADIFIEIWKACGTCHGNEDERLFVRTLAIKYLLRRALICATSCKFMLEAARSRAL